MNARTDVTNRQEYRQLVECGVESHVAKNIVRWRKNFRPMVSTAKALPRDEYKGMTYGQELTDGQKWRDAMADGAVLIGGTVHWPLRDTSGFYEGVEVVLDTGVRFAMPSKKKVELAS